MRGRSSGKTAPPATRASPGKAGGLKTKPHLDRGYQLNITVCNQAESTNLSHNCLGFHYSKRLRGSGALKRRQLV